MVGRDPSTGRLNVTESHLANKIALADFHATVTQDVVGGSSVEEEIRQHAVQQVGLTFIRYRIPGNFHWDVAILGAVKAI